MLLLLLSLSKYTIFPAPGLQRIQYAKTDSEVISKSKGSYGDKEKKKKDKKKTLELLSGAAKKPAGAVGSICLFYLFVCVCVCVSN